MHRINFGESCKHESLVIPKLAAIFEQMSVNMSNYETAQDEKEINPQVPFLDEESIRYGV